MRGYTDAHSNVLSNVNYSPIGVPDTNVIGPAFTGEWRTSGTGMQYHRARYYNPTLGVFPSLDPFEGITDRPMSLNGYSWVEGNVANSTDATGHIPSRNTNTIGDRHLAQIFGTGMCTSSLVAHMPSYSYCVDPCLRSIGVESGSLTSISWDQLNNYLDCLDTCHTTSACASMGMVMMGFIQPQNILDIADYVGINPVLLGMVVENESRSLGNQLSMILPTQLTYPHFSRSVGLANIKPETAREVIQRYHQEYMISEQQASQLTEWEILGYLLDPTFSILTAAFILHDLEQQILDSLGSGREEIDASGNLVGEPIRITLGAGGCPDARNCTISRLQLENMIIRSYQVGWDLGCFGSIQEGCSGFLNVLRDRRSGTRDWYEGIVNTIGGPHGEQIFDEPIVAQIQKLRNLESGVRRCLSS